MIMMIIIIIIIIIFTFMSYGRPTPKGSRDVLSQGFNIKSCLYRIAKPRSEKGGIYIK
jgi:hypothetical protein